MRVSNFHGAKKEGPNSRWLQPVYLIFKGLSAAELITWSRDDTTAARLSVASSIQQRTQVLRQSPSTIQQTLTTVSARRRQLKNTFYCSSSYHRDILALARTQHICQHQLHCNQCPSRYCETSGVSYCSVRTIQNSKLLSAATAAVLYIVL